MNTKICKGCNIPKIHDSFHKDSSSKDGRKSKCRTCIALYKKEYNKANNIDSNLWRKTKGNDWFKNWSKTKGKIYRDNLMKTNPDYKIYCSVSKRINHMLKAKDLYKTKSTLKYIGCTKQELRLHLEKQFTPEMNWDNYGTYWHVDHIIPVSYFDLSIEEERDIAFNYRNLQPLEAIANMKKGNRFIG